MPYEFKNTNCFLYLILIYLWQIFAIQYCRCHFIFEPTSCTIRFILKIAITFLHNIYYQLYIFAMAIQWYSVYGNYMIFFETFIGGIIILCKIKITLRHRYWSCWFECIIRIKINSIQIVICTILLQSLFRSTYLTKRLPSIQINLPWILRIGPNYEE